MKSGEILDRVILANFVLLFSLGVCALLFFMALTVFDSGSPTAPERQSSIRWISHLNSN
jgi:hypothetical protein